MDKERALEAVKRFKADGYEHLADLVDLFMQFEHQGKSVVTFGYALYGVSLDKDKFKKGDIFTFKFPDTPEGLIELAFDADDVDEGLLEFMDLQVIDLIIQMQPRLRPVTAH